MAPWEQPEAWPQIWVFPEVACRRWNQCRQTRPWRCVCGCVLLFGRVAVGAVGRCPAWNHHWWHAVPVVPAGRFRGVAESGVAGDPIRIS